MIKISSKGPYYKVLNEELNHKGFQYRMGLNIDTEEFNPSGSCESGGLYFTTKEHLCKFLDYGIYIAEVYIPFDAEVYKDPDEDKYKANKIIIAKITPIFESPLWEDVRFQIPARRYDPVMYDVYIEFRRSTNRKRLFKKLMNSF